MTLKVAPAFQGDWRPQFYTTAPALQGKVGIAHASVQHHWWSNYPIPSMYMDVVRLLDSYFVTKHDILCNIVIMSALLFSRTLINRDCDKSSGVIQVLGVKRIVVWSLWQASEAESQQGSWNLGQQCSFWETVLGFLLSCIRKWTLESGPPGYRVTQLSNMSYMLSDHKP